MTVEAMLVEAVLVPDRPKGHKISWVLKQWGELLPGPSGERHSREGQPRPS